MWKGFCRVRKWCLQRARRIYIFKKKDLKVVALPEFAKLFKSSSTISRNTIIVETKNLFRWFWKMTPYH